MKDITHPTPGDHDYIIHSNPNGSDCSDQADAAGYAAGPPEAHLCGAQRVGVIGGGNSAAQAAVWLARGGALVTLLHRRADLAETMSAT